MKNCESSLLTCFQTPDLRWKREKKIITRIPYQDESLRRNVRTDDIVDANILPFPEIRQVQPELGQEDDAAWRAFASSCEVRRS